MTDTKKIKRIGNEIKITEFKKNEFRYHCIDVSEVSVERSEL
jgi:hypothetical protein